MYDFLVSHAIKNVWCVPSQDRQSIIAPVKVTVAGGVLNRVSTQQRIYTLPVTGVRFHVYNLSQISPQRLGIDLDTNTWTPLSTICSDENLIIDLYVATGVQLPRFQAWYLVTPDRAVLLAVQDPTIIDVDLNTTTLYFRFYRNAYYNSPEAAALPVAPYVEVTGQVIGNQTDITTLQAKYLSYANLSGIAYAFVNGYRVQGVDLFTVVLGDIVEIVYDGSIYKVVDFPIDQLSMFTSTMDASYKYLLHYAGDGDSMIDYQDDIDGFLVSTPDSNGRFNGVFYHKNAGDTLRMVTHKDYSTPTALVQAFVTANGWLNASGLVLRLHIRKSGLNRPLIYENNRINELYKLDDTDLVEAMMGLNSTVTNWQAPVLEAAAYTQIMSAGFGGITNALVQTAYGYNEITYLTSNSPVETYAYSELQVIDVPYALQSNATMYEFDANGLLLGWYVFTGGSQYSCVNSDTALVQVISGTGGYDIDDTYGITPQTLDDVANYRMYTCPLVGGQPDGTKWVDVTGSSNYAIINEVLTWLTDTNTYTLVRGDTKFLAYDLSLMATDGILEFTLNQLATRDFLINVYQMEIPMGELDLWLNQHLLIEGIDYIFNFPNVYITNKAFLINPLVTEQNITVRWTGFCQTDLSRKTLREYGFVVNDRLSNNDVFNLRDGKVLQIQVGGAIKQRTDIRTAEDNTADTSVNSLNGLPYEIRPLVMPLRGMVAGETYDLLAASEAIDTTISQYLTQRLPEVDPATPSPIAALWAVYSPMCCKILYDMVAGTFVTPTAPYSDAGVAAAVADYLYLLAFDPTQSANAINSNFMQIDPHNLETVLTVSPAQYAFVLRVIALYLNNLVNLSHFVSISS